VSDNNRDAVIERDAYIKGQIRNGRRIEIYGHIEGQLAAETVVVHEGGRVFGTVRANDAEIRGHPQGDAVIRQLISIGSAGSVVGNVRYGRIALEPGGSLTAELRNIPPELAGDFNLVVGRGKSVPITPMDLAAIDPDDAAGGLSFSVSNVTNGWLVFADATGQAIAAFTQADLDAGKVLFRHDGNGAARASFDVVVADRAGATSGAPRTVEVVVRA